MAPPSPTTPAAKAAPDVGETLVTPLRADLVTSEQTYLGRAYVVVKNPLSLTYFRLSRAHFEAARRFAINVLAADQQAVADRFARRDVDRFAEATWEDWDGLPILSGALANFACTMFADHDGGDHRVIIGRVERLRMNAEHDPLLYFRGAYRRVHVPT